MIEILRTDEYDRWFRKLRDTKAKARIGKSILALSLGKSGNAKALRDGVSELRVDYGPGYRIYFTRREERIVILLCGGDKQSQRRDIEEAIGLAKEH